MSDVKSSIISNTAPTAPSATASGVVPPPAATHTTALPASAAPSATGSGGASKHPKPLDDMSEADVSDWIQSLGKPFEAYAKAFVDRNVDGTVLIQLTDSLLIKLGVSDEFHRLKIMGKIKYFQSQSGMDRDRLCCCVCLLLNH